MNAMTILLDGRRVTLPDRPYRRGGEAAVYFVQQEPGIVVKIYDDLDHPLSRERRVLAMRKMSPLSGRRRLPEQPPELAWPTGVATDMNRRFIGYSMGKFAKPGHVQILGLLDPAARRKLFENRVTWRSLLTIARSAAGIVEQLHAEDILVGDFSSRNIVVSTQKGFLTFLDCDSFAFTDPITGTHFPSRMRTDDYAAPERIEKAPATEASDDFALAVLIYQLLTGGDHPFAGQPNGTESWTPGDNIRDGNSHVVHPNKFVQPGTATKPDDLILPAHRADPAVLPVRALRFARETFGPGLTDPSRRPKARDWRAALDEAKDFIQVCAADPERHNYAEHLDACPWCGKPSARTRVPRRDGSPAWGGGSAEWKVRAAGDASAPDLPSATAPDPRVPAEPAAAAPDPWRPYHHPQEPSVAATATGDQQRPLAGSAHDTDSWTSLYSASAPRTSSRAVPIMIGMFVAMVVIGLLAAYLL